MDLNDLQINLGHLDRYIELAEAGKPFNRSALITVLSLVDEQEEELLAFLQSANDTMNKARRLCSV